MQELGESLIVSLLNRSKDTDQELFVFFEIHKSRYCYLSAQRLNHRGGNNGIYHQ